MTFSFFFRMYCIYSFSVRHKCIHCRTMLDTPTADVGHPLRQLRIVVQGKGAYIRKMGAGIICRSEDLVGNIRRGRQHNSVILQ